MGRSLPKSVNMDWIQQLRAYLVTWSTFMAVDWCTSFRLPIQAESVVQSQGNSFLIWGDVSASRQTDGVVWGSTPVCTVNDASLAALFIEDSGFQLFWFGSSPVIGSLKCRSVCPTFQIGLLKWEHWRKKIIVLLCIWQHFVVYQLSWHLWVHIEAMAEIYSWKRQGWL